MMKILIIFFLLQSFLVNNFYCQQLENKESNYSDSMIGFSSGVIILDKANLNDYSPFDKSRLLINVSYEILDRSSLNTYPSVGLKNEIGIKNSLLYVKFEPRFLLNEQFAIDLHLGLGMIVALGPLTKPAGFLAFGGVSPTFSFDITKKSKIEVEAGIDGIFLNKPALFSYLMVGLKYRLGD